MNIPILEYWYRALGSTHGVEITTSDPEKAKPLLYKARAESNDKALWTISIRPSPFDPFRLWLVKKEDPNAQT